MKLCLPIQVLVERFLLRLRPLREIARRWNTEPECDFDIASYFRRPVDGFPNFGTFTV
jgi:hypothetical protein